MNFLRVTDFKEFFVKALTVIVNYLNKSNEINLDLYFNEDANFINRFKKITKKDLFISHHRADHNFPSLYKSKILFDNGYFISRAGASEYMNDLGISLCKNKARGEFLERLSTRAPINLCLKCNFDYKKVSEALTNIKGIDFLTRKKIILSNLDVYWGLRNLNQELSYLKDGNVRKKIQRTTSGSAGYFDTDNALLSAILEMIQRDAFLVYWLNSISPKKIDVANYILSNKNAGEKFEQLKGLYENTKRYNIGLFFLDTTSDLAIPSVTCVAVIDDGNGNKKEGLGACSGFDIDSILLGAMTEALSVLSDNYKKEVHILDTEYKPFSDKNLKREERLKIYCDNKDLKQFKYFEFFINSKVEISINDFMFSVKNVKQDTTSRLEYLKKIFLDIKKENKEFNLSYVEIKNKLLKEFDYKVIRVISDYFYNLYLDESYADPNHPRLKEFIKNKGLESESKLNIWPHPFP